MRVTEIKIIEIKIKSESPWEDITAIPGVIYEANRNASAARSTAVRVALESGATPGTEIRWNWKGSSQGHYFTLQ